MHSYSLIVFATVALAQTAHFEWDCTNSLGPCNNACYAVNNGLAANVLTYDSDASNRPPRRTASGCNRTPCSNTNYGQWGNSCDEYPFASTFEGGTNAILRCVDGSENSSEGGQLSNFYGGISNGTQFDIFVRNYGGATFCENTGAANDGSEFRLVNGAFQNAKMRRDNGFADAEPRGPPKKLREFEDENGERLLSLNPDMEGTLVGTTVPSRGRFVKVVREI
ncbi:hypothetical protein DL769_010523 [Monosporascus sp. CRB-8-3]|nr:hypothetical protein DL769_010523 [Monosporascus sp. CRB-8-3]